MRGKPCLVLLTNPPGSAPTARRRWTNGNLGLMEFDKEHMLGKRGTVERKKKKKKKKFKATAGVEMVTNHPCTNGMIWPFPERLVKSKWSDPRIFLSGGQNLPHHSTTVIGCFSSAPSPARNITFAHTGHTCIQQTLPMTPAATDFAFALIQVLLLRPLARSLRSKVHPSRAEPTMWGVPLHPSRVALRKQQTLLRYDV